MICDVLLTQQDKRFIARVCQYPEIVVEDDTEEAVLATARVKLNKLLSKSRIVKLDIEAHSYEHPWQKYAGMFSDDADWEMFQESVREYRKQTDSDIAGA